MLIFIITVELSVSVFNNYSTEYLFHYIYPIYLDRIPKSEHENVSKPQSGTKYINKKINSVIAANQFFLHMQARFLHVLKYSLSVDQEREALINCEFLNIKFRKNIMKNLVFT